MEVVPNGVDVEKFSPKDGTEERQGLVFVGGAGWFPNRDGMEHFAEEILPESRVFDEPIAVAPAPVGRVAAGGAVVRQRWHER